MTPQGKFYHGIRDYLFHQGFHEVLTPCLVSNPGAEVHLDFFKFDDHRYLRSSPELQMKALWADSSYLSASKVYQIGSSFRHFEELSPWHAAEFVMLEYYAPFESFDHFMDWHVEFLYEVASLNQGAIRQNSIYKSSMAEAFEEFTGCHLFGSPEVFISQVSCKFPYVGSTDDFLTAYQKVLINEIEPRLKTFDVAVLYDFPAAQHVLAKTRNDIAKRMEVYVKGIEISNGFEELIGSRNNQEKMKEINKQRLELKKHPINIDSDFLAGSERFPEVFCGNAIGLDRLYAVLKGFDGIFDRPLLPKSPLL